MNKLTRREQEIAKRVRSARESMRPKVTQEEVGNKLGLSQVGYSHYEAFRVPFTVEQLFKLSSILRRSVHHLLGLETGLTELEEKLLSSFQEIQDVEFQLAAILAVRNQVRMAHRVRDLQERLARQEQEAGPPFSVRPEPHRASDSGDIAHAADRGSK